MLLCVCVCEYVCVCVCERLRLRVLAAGGGLRSETSRAQVRVDQTPQSGEVLPHPVPWGAREVPRGSRGVLPYRVPRVLRRYLGVLERSYRIECRATAQTLPWHGVASPYGSRRHIPLAHALMTREHEYSRSLPPSVRRSLPPSLSGGLLACVSRRARVHVQVAGTSLVQIDVVRAAWLGYSYSPCGGHMVLAYPATSGPVAGDGKASP